jgi:hypothetical protein
MIRSLGLGIMYLLVSACSGDGREGSPESAADQPGPADSTAGNAAHTVADLQALRYLEGEWRGSGYEGGPFYESYRFVNDSTIEMTSWSDSTMTTPQERSEYALRNGVIRADNGGRLVRVDQDGHHFRRGSSAWTFRQVSADRWTAQVGPATTYTMDRLTSR